ncbi:flagellar brake domain-containing protein [Nitrospinota bacterium]
MLPVGSVVMLVDPVNKVRMHSRLIGWDEGDCMMLEQPIRGGSGVQLPKDLAVVGRGMYEGRVWGFKANVLFQTVQPFRILFLSYPAQIEEVSLRKSERIQTSVDVILSARKHVYEELKDSKDASRGVIKNISTGGCNISCPFRFEVNMPVFISGELPTGKVMENLMGFVRNVTRDQSNNFYGIQFEERSGSLDTLREFIALALKIVSRDNSDNYQ